MKQENWQHEFLPVCKYKLCGITTAPTIAIISNASLAFVSTNPQRVPLKNSGTLVSTNPQEMNKTIASRKMKRAEMTVTRRSKDFSVRTIILVGGQKKFFAGCYLQLLFLKFFVPTATRKVEIKWREEIVTSSGIISSTSSYKKILTRQNIVDTKLIRTPTKYGNPNNVLNAIATPMTAGRSVKRTDISAKNQDINMIGLEKLWSRKSSCKKAFITNFITRW